MQPNKAASISTPRCFKCGESGHRMADCHKGDKYGKSLLIEFGEVVDNLVGEFEQDADFDDK